MGAHFRERRTGSSPAAGLGRAVPSVDTTYAVVGGSTPRESAGPPTTVPPSPRTLGPRRATPVGGEYSIVPRRRT